jgi:hypothetical protein
VTSRTKANCDQAPEPTSLPYSSPVCGFPTFFHHYRDSNVTANLFCN